MQGTHSLRDADYINLVLCVVAVKEVFIINFFWATDIRKRTAEVFLFGELLHTQQAFNRVASNVVGFNAVVCVDALLRKLHLIRQSLDRAAAHVGKNALK